MTAGTNSRGSSTNSYRIYSPAPPRGPLHVLNRNVVETLAEGGLGFPVTMISKPLPDSVNGIADLEPEERKLHLPIMTAVDFGIACNGGSPSTHAYQRANHDLKFVARLYDVGFGVQVPERALASPDALKGKRIGVPGRPSAVRLLTEILLGDGWGILDDVDLVEIAPQNAAESLCRGELDALSWNLVIPTGTGHEPMLPLEGFYLPVDDKTLYRINEAGRFTFERAQLLSGQPPLISFAQALAAWDETAPDDVRAMLTCLSEAGATKPGLPVSLADMRHWPELQEADMHPAALGFYHA